MKVNISGSWKNGVSWVNVGGTWRKGIATWVNISGTWKKMAYSINKIVFTQPIADTSYKGAERYGTVDINKFTMTPSEYPCTGLKFYTWLKEWAPAPKDAWIDILVKDAEESLRLYNTLRAGKTGIILKGTGTTNAWFNSSNATFERFSASGDVRITPKDKSILFLFLKRNRGRTIEMTVNIDE